jgi:hypothetical protein
VSSAPLSESEQIEQLKTQLQWAELKIQVLEERLRLQLIAKYGPASEKLNDAQLELLELELGSATWKYRSRASASPNHPIARNLRRINILGGSNCLPICHGARRSFPAHQNSAPAEYAASKRW